MADNVIQLPEPGELKAAALALARAGYSVFPCKGQTPYLTGGFKQATTNTATIEGWWRKWPYANIGLATGAINMLLVVDSDPRNDGDAGIARLVSEYGPLPPTRTHKTGRDGRHRLYSITGPVRSRQGLVKGVDVKADGGYVITVPSVHGVSHKPYTVELDIPIAPAPAWLVELCGKPRAHSLASGEEDGEPIGEGQRNQFLTSVAGVLRRRGLGEAAILAALLAENDARCAPPLAESEVKRIASGIMRYAAGTTSGEHLSDLGNARRLVVASGHLLHWSVDEGSWLLWSDHRWSLDRRGEVMQFAIETVGGIHREAAREPDEEYAKKLRAHALRSESNERLNAMLKLAMSEPGMSLLSDQLDAGALSLGTPGGVLDAGRG